MLKIIPAGSVMFVRNSKAARAVESFLKHKTSPETDVSVSWLVLYVIFGSGDVSRVDRRGDWPLDAVTVISSDFWLSNGIGNDENRNGKLRNGRCENRRGIRL